MGARGGELPIGARGSARDFATLIVREVLKLANQDWRIWASLCHVLPLLAEAGPDEFLAAAEKGMEGQNPIFLDLFSDKSAQPVGPSSPHPALQWALGNRSLESALSLTGRPYSRKACAA